MAEKSGPIYEVRIFVDRDAVADCDAWLEEHVRESLRDAAVTDCYVSSVAADEEGHAGRVCHYILQDDNALDDFLGTLSAQIESELSSRFHDQVSFTDRPDPAQSFELHLSEQAKQNDRQRARYQ